MSSTYFVDSVYVITTMRMTYFKAKSSILSNANYVQHICPTRGPPRCVMRLAVTCVNNGYIVKLHDNFGG